MSNATFSQTVSVLVATCNRAPLLAEALDSLLQQTRPADQIVVVDDGSTDSTQELLASYGDRIETLHCHENGGKARALNRAMPRVEGDLVWIFDDDDLALPQALERHLQYFESHPEIDLTYSALVLEGPGLPRTEVALPEVEEGGLFRALLPRNFLFQQGMLVRSSCYAQVGPFAEDLVRAQDYDMILRLSRVARSAPLPGPPTFVYRQHQGGRGLGGRQFDVSQRNRVWLDYDRRLIQRLFDEVALWELVPGATADRPLNQRQRRHALLRRCSAWVLRGLWDRGLLDLGRALEATDTALDGAEEMLWRAAFEDNYGSRIGLERFLEDPDLTRRIEERCSGPAGRQLLSILAERLTALARWLNTNPGDHEIPTEVAVGIARDAHRLTHETDPGQTLAELRRPRP